MATGKREDIERSLLYDGFVLIPGLISSAHTQELGQRVEVEIANLAATFNLTPERYTSSVSIWRTDSTVVELVRDTAVEAVSLIIKNLRGPDT